MGTDPMCLVHQGTKASAICENALTCGEDGSYGLEAWGDAEAGSLLLESAVHICWRFRGGLVTADGES